jgi:hypothetical protein
MNLHDALIDIAANLRAEGQTGRALIIDTAADELSALRELLAGIRETRHLADHAYPPHIKAALGLCEEQLKAVERIEQ